MSAKTETPTAVQIEALRSYLEKPCHGHGMFYGVTGQLYRARYLDLNWTGAKDWILSINAKGRRVLEDYDATGIRARKVA